MRRNNNNQEHTWKEEQLTNTHFLKLNYKTKTMQLFPTKYYYVRTKIYMLIQNTMTAVSHHTFVIKAK